MTRACGVTTFGATYCAVLESRMQQSIPRLGYSLAMTQHPPVVISRSHGRLQCNVAAVPDWEGFDKLVQFLTKHYGAEVVESVDGPDARRCWMEVREHVLEIEHEDPWGNTIVAPTEAAEPVLQQVAEDLVERLKNISP